MTLEFFEATERYRGRGPHIVGCWFILGTIEVYGIIMVNIPGVTHVSLCENGFLPHPSRSTKVWRSSCAPRWGTERTGGPNLENWAVETLPWPWPYARISRNPSVFFFHGFSMFWQVRSYPSFQFCVQNGGFQTCAGNRYIFIFLW